MSDDTPTRNVRGWVQRYLERGWHPLPLKFAEKELRDKDGLKRTYALEDFTESDNVGLQLGSSRSGVAIDFDASEITPDVVWRFLPASFGWGRASKPLSQVLYKCGIDKSLVLRDLGAVKEKATLVEVRATHQSMVPPSVHPNSEDIMPVNPDLTATDLDPKVLLRAARLLATYALIIRYYPPSGARHYWGLHLVGFFRYLDLKQDEVTQLIQLSARTVSDPEIKDRLDVIRSTFARDDDDPIGGAKLLAENMDPERGPKFIASLRSIWGDAGRTAKEIERLNTKHAILFSRGGSVVVMTEDGEGLRYTRANDFKLLYPEPVIVGANKAGDVISKPLGEVWLTHPARRMYWGTQLCANGGGRQDYYNRWKGFTVEPKKGDWSLYRKQLQALVNHDEDCEAYVLAWLALTVRYPDQPIGTCIAFRGEQGCGKTTFCKWFGELFGSHFIHLDSERRLLGNFNAHLENAIVVLADEAVWAGGKQGLGALKRMITEDTLDIERKYLDTVQEPNRIHLLVNSNEDWVVPKSLNDRRFLVLSSSDELRGNVAFFSAVWKQLHEGGLAALLYDLLNDETLLRDTRVLPRTAEGEKQQRLSMESLHAWWVDELESGELWSKDAEQGELFVFPRARLVARAEGLLGKNSRYNVTPITVGIFLSRVLPRGFPQKWRKQHGGERENLWGFPTWKGCREAWLRIYPGTLDDE